MRDYYTLLRKVLVEGVRRPDRTGVGTVSLFGEKLIVPVHLEAFPIVTRKFVPFHLVVSELVWMLRGDTNLKFLHEHKNRIWDEWADKDGNLGPIYGAQWRSWLKATVPDRGSVLSGQSCLAPLHPVDQIKGLLEGLLNDPYGRRHIVSAWNVGDIDTMKLPPCHSFFQCYVTIDESFGHSEGAYTPVHTVDLQLYQRSADLFLGVPFNISSYALLLCLICKWLGEEYQPGNLHVCFGDAHIYLNHLGVVEEMLGRPDHALPTLNLNQADTSHWLTRLEPSDILLEHYKSGSALKAEVAV